MLPEIAKEEWAAALDDVVAEVLRRAEIRRPPVDALEVARAFDLSITLDERQTGRARMVRLRAPVCFARGAIVLRPEPRGERLQWAIAHEIGEVVAHRVFDVLSVDPREADVNAREAVANQLASRLLLPSQWFFDCACRDDWDLLKLKFRFATASHELIARRMLDFAEPLAAITVFDHGKLTLRRSNFPGSLPALSAGERECQAAAHSTGKVVRRILEQLNVVAWPIHDPKWKREILRTVPQEDPQ